MRIALFHTTLPEAGRKPGGVEVAVHRLANALAEAGDEVTVYSLTPAPPEARYGHHRLFTSAPWLRNAAFGRLLVLPALLNFTDFGDAQVVHLHGDDWFYLWRNKPTVRTLHGSALREAQAARFWLRRWSQYAVYPLEHLSARLCRRAVAVGDDAARLYHTSGTVDNGVDPEMFFPGEKSSTPLVVYAGTWGGRKRGEFLYRVFTEQVLPRVPDARLVMAIDSCPPHPAVECVGFPSDRALAELYRRAWVFAYPSTYEGFGICYAEALASGTAVLSSPNAGAEYVLDAGRYGVIAQDADFADRLVDLLSSGDRRRGLEQAGLDRARRFSWKSVAAAHREIYRSVVSST